MPPANDSWLRLLIPAWLLCAGVGCMPAHKPAPPLVADHAGTVTVAHFQGTPLSGAILHPPAAIDPDDALAVDVEFLALEQRPHGFDPLGARTRLIVASHGANPVRSTAGLTRTATCAVGADARRLASLIYTGAFQRRVPIGRAIGAVAPGTTARFEVTDSGKPDVTRMSGLGHRRFQVLICRPDKTLFLHHASSQPATEPATLPATLPATRPTSTPASSEIELAVVLDDLASLDSAANGQERALETRDVRAQILNMETVLLDPIEPDLQPAMADRPAAVIAVPFKLRDGQNQAMVAVIRISRASSGSKAQRALCEQASRELTQAWLTAKNDAAARPPFSPDEVTVLDLLASIALPGTRRAAAAYLASWSGARICEDAVLSCDDEQLTELTGRFSQDVAKVAAQKSAVGWRLDLATLTYLAKLQADGKLPPELTALLADRAGEAGRHPSAMEEILRGVAGPVDLDERLVATNRLYLEDSSPASRARAYDWLKNRNRHEEPAGFFPLAPPRARRDAIEKDLLDRAAAATRPATQPTGAP